MSYHKTTQKIRRKFVKKIGIIRDVDKLGRICIPKEMRNMYNLNESVEILATTEGVLIRNPEYILVKIEKISKNDSQ